MDDPEASPKNQYVRVYTWTRYRREVGIRLVWL